MLLALFKTDICIGNYTSIHTRTKVVSDSQMYVQGRRCKYTDHQQNATNRLTNRTWVYTARVQVQQTHHQHTYIWQNNTHETTQRQTKTKQLKLRLPKWVDVDLVDVVYNDR